MKYSVVSRRKGNRRAYSDGFIYPDYEYAERIAQEKYMSGHYTMVKIVDHESNRLIKQYSKSKQ